MSVEMGDMPEKPCSNRYCMDGWVDKETGSEVEQVPCQVCGIHCEPEEQPDDARHEFMECDTCRANCGSPVLCEGCLHNRRIINSLRSYIGIQ